MTLVSENETYLLNDYINDNLNNKDFYILNTLREGQLSVPVMRNMLFQKQIFGFCEIENGTITNLALFIYPSEMEETSFVQVLYLYLNNVEFFKDAISNARRISDDISKIKLLINSDEKYQKEKIENLGFKKEVSFKVGNKYREHYSIIF